MEREYIVTKTELEDIAEYMGTTFSLKDEVVRCKDCESSFVLNDADREEACRACKLLKCTDGLLIVNDDDFCSWAVRKETF